MVNIYFEFNLNRYKVYLVNKKCSTFVLSQALFLKWVMYSLAYYFKIYLF